MYNTWLSLFFLLSTRYRIKNSKIRRSYYEPFFHILSIGYPFTVATYAIFKGYMNPTPVACMIAEKPRGCIGNDCIRGKNYKKFRIYSLMIPVLILIMIIAVSMLMLYMHVKKLEDAVHSYSSRWTRRLSGKQSKRVFRQSMLYISAFSIVWFPFMIQGSIIKVLYGDNAKLMYWSLLIVNILTPLQGLFNALIYARINPVVELVILARSSFTTLRRHSLRLSRKTSSTMNKKQNIDEKDGSPKDQSECLEE